MSGQNNYNRRSFLGTAAMTLTTAQLSALDNANAQSNAAQPAERPSIKPGTHTSFGPLKQIDAGVLSVG
jgi:hypothetical protein